MSHSSYLINLGSANPEVHEKSEIAFKEELKRCHALDIAFLNFHPGSAGDKPPTDCLDQIISSLKKMDKLCEKGKTKLLLETTAGQGTSVPLIFSPPKFDPMSSFTIATLASGKLPGSSV